MKNNYHKQFEILEKTRLNIITLAKKLDGTQQNTPTAPDKWSVNQIICHLIMAENGTLESMNKRIMYGKVKEKITILSAIRLFMLKFILNNKIKLKAPEAVAYPPNISDFDENITKWNEIRNKLKTYIQNFDATLANNMIFKHPIAGPMNLRQLLEYLHAHQSAHEKQIADIVSSISK
ncbi:MAG: DinB family protein [Cytophagales bacterium]|nr:DinB family protein [Cytophagales bacterium]